MKASEAQALTIQHLEGIELKRIEHEFQIALSNIKSACEKGKFNCWASKDDAVMKKLIDLGYTVDMDGGTMEIIWL